MALGLEPISFEDSRQAAATWLDHAGVSSKVASVVMGHKTPKPRQQSGAAPTTLRRYTHVLEGELSRAWLATLKMLLRVDDESLGPELGELERRHRRLSTTE